MSYSKLQRHEMIAGYLFLLPSFLGFSVFIIFPVFFSLFLSFTEWNMISPMRFVGLQNFIRIFTEDEMFLRVLGNTFRYMLLVIPTGLTLALAWALALNRKLKGRIIFRSIFFLPVVISFAASGMVWSWLLNREFGLINYILGFFNIPLIGWLVDPQFSMLVASCDGPLLLPSIITHISKINIIKS